MTVAKRLLVGSVYANSSKQQQEWFQLQSAYLKATTCDFDHVIFVAHSDASAFDGKVKVVGTLSDDPINMHDSEVHLRGLIGLQDYFRSVQSEYDRFLFLDSDAFPIRKNWEALLSEKMVGRCCPESQTKEIAIVVRPELCEFRWHPSVIFATRDGLNNLEFRFSKMTYLDALGKDFLGHVEHDVHVNYQEPQLRGRVLPLMRTNQHNVHFVACGVYYDMFYHHTFGAERGQKQQQPRKYRLTPWKSLRGGGKYGYGDFYADSRYLYKEFYAELMANPSSFINKLAGWSQSEYPEIGCISK